MSIIIGVSGKKQAGKSTLCEYLTDRYKSQFDSIKIYSFADPLKRFCVDGMGLSEEQCYGPDEDKNTFTKYKWDTLPIEIRNKFSIKGEGSKRGPMTAREVLQIFGTNVMRKMFSDKIWVNATISLIKREKPTIAFIADVRFRSEIDALMNEKDGYAVRLTRRLFDDSHPSEVDLDDFDFRSLGDRCLVIDNQNLTIDEKNDIAVPFFERITGI